MSKQTALHFLKAIRGKVKELNEITTALFPPLLSLSSFL